MKNTTLASVISSALLLTACGGGSDGIVGSGAVAQYTLKGNVPGTTIEAYCDDGSFHQVESDASAGLAEHPFKLNTLPVSTPCRVVVITHPAGEALTDANKVVTPVEFMDANGKVSIAVTSSGGDIDLKNELMDVNLTRTDLDNDGTPDVIDTKQVVALDDNDATVVEKSTDPLDSDGDGLINAYEDDDNDGLLNHDDLDDDGNGVNDRDENNLHHDLDRDGIPDNDDIDIDNDGRNNDVDNDDDNDGTPDRNDTDDDNDGIEDRNETDHHNGTDNDDRGGNDNDDHNGSDNDDRNGNDNDDHNGTDNDSHNDRN